SSHSKILRNPMFSHDCCVDQLNLQLSIWRKAATLFGDDDPEGFILLSTFLANLVLAVAGYKWVVRCLEKRMNKPG
ncbi:hypothetical protein ACFP9W_03275, partial [Tatumella terrea]